MYDTIESLSNTIIRHHTCVLLVTQNRQEAVFQRILGGFTPKIVPPSIIVDAVFNPEGELPVRDLVRAIEDVALLSEEQIPTARNFRHLTSSTYSVWDDAQKADVTHICRYYAVYIPNPIIKPGSEILTFDRILNASPNDLVELAPGLKHAIQTYIGGTLPYPIEDRSQDVTGQPTRKDKRRTLDFF